MIGLLALSLQTSSSSAVSSITPNDQVAPKDLTIEASAFDCQLTSDDGQKFALVINDGGARGSRDSASGETLVRQEPVSFVSEPASLLEGYTFQSGMQSWDRHYNGWKKSGPAKFGKSVEIELLPTTTASGATPSRFAITITEQNDDAPMFFFTRAVGFCELRPARRPERGQ